MALGGGGGGGGASARGVRAGAAYVELNGKDNLSGFLKRMGAKFAGAVKAMGAAAVVGLGAGFTVAALAAGPLLETLDDLRRLDDVAKAFGITGRAASGLFGVLGAVGGDLKENLEGVIQFSGTMEKAVQGVGQGAELFDGLAITAQQLNGLAVDEQFYRVLGAIRQLPQPMQQAKLAMLGGTDSMKQWQGLLSLSEQDVRSLAERLSFTNLELQRAADAGRAYQRATGAIGRAWQQVAVAVAPAVQSIAEWVERAATGFTEWVRGRELGNILEEVWVRARIGVQELIITLRDGLSALWGSLTTGGNFSAFSGALWDLVKSLVGYVLNSLATAVPIITRGLSELIKNALMASATLKIALGDEAGAKQDIEAVAMMTPEFTRKALADAMAADAAAFDGARKQLDGFGKDLAARFEASAKANAEADAANRAELNAELARVQDAAARQRNTAAFREFMDGGGAAGQSAAVSAAKIGRAMGTFGGSGDFIARSFGGGGIPKQQLAEQKRANQIAGEQLKLIRDLASRPGFVVT